MDNRQKYKVEFPEEMEFDEREWIKERMFKFLERHSCTIKREKNADDKENK